MIEPSSAIVAAQLLGVAVAGAVIGLRAPRLLRLPAFARALVGVCLTPFLIAAFTVVAALVWPGASRVVYVIPLAASVLVIFWGRASLGWAIRRGRRGLWTCSGQWDVLTARIGMTAALLWVLLLLAGNSLQPVVGHDALIYFNEAREFSAVRSAAAIPDFTAQPGEIIATHPHAFGYQAYLANAFITGSASLGPPDDLGARIASQATVAFFLLGVLALAGVSRTRGLASLALLFTLGLTAFGYLTQHDSRDGVRILSLILLTLTLIPLVSARRRPANREYLLPMLAASLAIYAHTLNILFVGILGLGVIVVGLTGRIAVPRLIKLALAIGLGMLLPGSHYLQSWLDTGSLLGHGMYYSFYRDTPLWDAFVAQSDWSQTDVGFVGALLAYAGKYGYLLTLGGIPASLAIAIAHPLRRLRLIAWFFLFSLLVPLSGVFDGGAVGIKQAMLANVRYPLVIYPFAAVALAATLFFLARRFPMGTTRVRHKDRWLLATVALAATLGALQALDKWTYRSWAPAYVSENYLSLGALIEANLGEGENWATDLYAAAYYAPRQPLFLFSKRGSGLFRTDSQAEVRRLLEENRVGIVALRNDIETWWGRTAFLRVLEEDAASKSSIGFWTVYRLGEPQARTLPNELRSAMFAPGSGPGV